VMQLVPHSMLYSYMWQLSAHGVEWVVIRIYPYAIASTIEQKNAFTH
jgi:hypothetical protein